MAFIWQPIVPRVPQAHVVVNQARWREKESEREREGSALSFLVPDLDSDRFFHFLPWFLIGFSLVSRCFSAAGSSQCEAAEAGNEASQNRRTTNPLGRNSCEMIEMKFRSLGQIPKHVFLIVCVLYKTQWNLMDCAGVL